MNTVEKAKEIRKELKIKFPGVKFSVRTKKYSGGSSISVSWTDFPTVAAVEEITNKYESIRYDEYTGEILSGGNTYIHTYNTWSQEIETAIKENLIKKYGIEFYNEYINNSYDFYRYAREIYQDMYKDTLIQNTKVEEAAEGKKVLYSNEEIQIIEAGKTTRIYFDGKPSEEIRNNIKSLGFKFYKNDGFYWGIYTNKTTLKAIKAALQIETIENTIEDLETIAKHEQEYINAMLKEEAQKEIEPIEIKEAATSVYLNDIKIARKINNISEVEDWGENENILIEKYIILNNNDFDYMCNNLLNNYTFIKGLGGSRAEAKEGADVPEEYDINYLYANRNKFNFYEINILVTNADNNKFIIVNPHGYSYCRYTGILTAAEGKRVLRQLEGETKANKLQVIESKINESEDLTNAERCNNIYLEIEALEKRLKLVKSDKLKYKLQDQINNKMKEIAKIILSDELLYMQFIKETKE